MYGEGSAQDPPQQPFVLVCPTFLKVAKVHAGLGTPVIKQYIADFPYWTSQGDIWEDVISYIIQPLEGKKTNSAIYQIMEILGLKLRTGFNCFKIPCLYG